MCISYLIVLSFLEYTPFFIFGGTIFIKRSLYAIKKKGGGKDFKLKGWTCKKGGVKNIKGGGLSLTPVHTVLKYYTYDLSHLLDVRTNLCSLQSR